MIYFCLMRDYVITDRTLDVALKQLKIVVPAKNSPIVTIQRLVAKSRIVEPRIPKDRVKSMVDLFPKLSLMMAMNIEEIPPK